MVRLLTEENRIIPEAIAEQAEAIARAVELITCRMMRGGRLVYVGAGTSGRMGVMDASECPPTFSVAPDRFIGLIAGGDAALRKAIEGAEDDQEAARVQMEEIRLGADDVVCGITASGGTPYVIGAHQYARGLGCATVCVVNNRHSRLAELSDVAIEVEVGPEAIGGSTRLKAGTAQKLVLNILSTATMIRQGKTYGNLMVDLRATNRKLHTRSLIILREIFPEESCSAFEGALEKSGGSVKLAAALIRTRKDPEEAQALLMAHDGSLRRLFEATSGETGR